MSLYLGQIGGRVNGAEKMFEIHAFTNGLPYDGYKTSEISDPGLFQKMLEGRYKVLESGKAIYCTAVRPDKEKKIETNPHDYRPGTVHIATLDQEGNIICGLGIATDTGEKDGGQLIGLPLENRWRPGDYPAGASLDPFRERYIKATYGKDRALKPGEMAELYRHFKLKAGNGDLPARLGTYAGAYNLTVRQARKRGSTPTWVWVFDAIPPYFNLYRWAGAAVLRDYTIKDPPEHLSPNKGQLKTFERVNGEIVPLLREDGSRGIFYKGKDVSRDVLVPIPSGKGEKITFERKNIPFLDGVVNIREDERAVIESPILISPIMYKGMNLSDRINLRTGLSVMGARVFEDAHSRKPIINFVNSLLRRHIESEKMNFNGVGELGDMSFEQMYAYDI